MCNHINAQPLTTYFGACPFWLVPRVYFYLFFLSLPRFGSPFALSSFFVFLSFCFTFIYILYFAVYCIPGLIKIFVDGRGWREKRVRYDTILVPISTFDVWTYPNLLYDILNTDDGTVGELHSFVHPLYLETAVTFSRPQHLKKTLTNTIYPLPSILIIILYFVLWLMILYALGVVDVCC